MRVECDTPHLLSPPVRPHIPIEGNLQLHERALGIVAVLQPHLLSEAPSVATWELREGTLLCCAWTLGTLAKWGCVCVPPHLTVSLSPPSVLHPASHHLSAGDHCWNPCLRLLPAGEGPGGHMETWMHTHTHRGACSCTHDPSPQAPELTPVPQALKVGLGRVDCRRQQPACSTEAAHLGAPEGRRSLPAPALPCVHLAGSPSPTTPAPQQVSEPSLPLPWSPLCASPTVLGLCQRLCGPHSATPRRVFDFAAETATASTLAERGAQGEPEGHHDQAVPSAGPRGRHQRRGQAAAGGWRVTRGGARVPSGLLGTSVGVPGQGWVRWELSRLFRLQFHCCGSNNSQDWRASEWIRSGDAGGRVVPDSCCKTVVAYCGQRDHASNIYKVEVGGQGLGTLLWDARGWRGPGAAAVGAGGLAGLQHPPLSPARAAASLSWRPSSRSI